jgi:hypothetical protein
MSHLDVFPLRINFKEELCHVCNIYELLNNVTLSKFFESSKMSNFMQASIKEKKIMICNFVGEQWYHLSYHFDELRDLCDDWPLEEEDLAYVMYKDKMTSELLNDFEDKCFEITDQSTCPCDLHGSEELNARMNTIIIDWEIVSTKIDLIFKSIVKTFNLLGVRCFNNCYT